MPASISATKLWDDVREALPEMDEPLQVDRFLDTVVIRMRHADRMAEPGVNVQKWDNLMKKNSLYNDRESMMLKSRDSRLMLWDLLRLKYPHGS